MCRRTIAPIAVLCVWMPAAIPERAPVLVELFTSEGCSSCPPADRLLEKLDPSVIVLSEHVDYWDRLGWRDPFSSHANTLRQEGYSRQFETEGPYTPQMVIDGAVQFVGSDAPRAAAEIGKAAARQRVSVRLKHEGSTLEIETGPVPHAAEVWLAIAEDRTASQVTAGENRGRNLRHVAVERNLRKIGSVRRGSPFHQSIALDADATGKRLIVFVQEPNLGRVSGAGLLVP